MYPFIDLFGSDQVIVLSPQLCGSQVSGFLPEADRNGDMVFPLSCIIDAFRELIRVISLDPIAAQSQLSVVSSPNSLLRVVPVHQSIVVVARSVGTVVVCTLAISILACLSGKHGPILFIYLNNRCSFTGKMAGQYLGHLISIQLIVMLAPPVLDFLNPFSDLDIGCIINSNFTLIGHQLLNLRLFLRDF